MRHLQYFIIIVISLTFSSCFLSYRARLNCIIVNNDVIEKLYIYNDTLIIDEEGFIKESKYYFKDYNKRVAKGAPSLFRNEEIYKYYHGKMSDERLLHYIFCKFKRETQQCECQYFAQNSNYELKIDTLDIHVSPKKSYKIAPYAFYNINSYDSVIISYDYRTNNAPRNLFHHKSHCITKLILVGKNDSIIIGYNELRKRVNDFWKNNRENFANSNDWCIFIPVDSLLK